MSHSPLRKEKNCLNCNTHVHGRFCHVCGQENIEIKQSFWSLAQHFVYDILHFDGKFFSTLGYIFLRPGFVARQYTEGKRISYLHPIRMYLFTSAVFFLVFFSINTIEENKENLKVNLNHAERKELAVAWQKQLDKNPGDTLLRQRIHMLNDTTIPINPNALGWQAAYTTFLINKGQSYASDKEYGTVQNKLPQKARDDWFKKQLNIYTIKLSLKYGTGKEGIMLFREALLHKLPYLLFVSLPFFALLLKLIYIRHKSFYYSDHAVFTLYHYILSFILLLLVFGMNALYTWSGWSILNHIISVLSFSWLLYLFLEMKNFYRQTYKKTLFKFVLLNMLGFMVMLVLFILFLMFSIIQV